MGAINILADIPVTQLNPATSVHGMSQGRSPPHTRTESDNAHVSAIVANRATASFMSYPLKENARMNVSRTVLGIFAPSQRSKHTG